MRKAHLREVAEVHQQSHSNPIPWSCGKTPKASSIYLYFLMSPLANKSLQDPQQAGKLSHHHFAPLSQGQLTVPAGYTILVETLLFGVSQSIAIIHQWDNRLDCWELHLPLCSSFCLLQLLWGIQTVIQLVNLWNPVISLGRFVYSWSITLDSWRFPVWFL